MSEAFVMPEDWPDSELSIMRADGSSLPDPVALPTFFFHLHSYDDVRTDDLGLDLPGVGRVRWAARHLVKDLLSGASPTAEAIDKHRFEVVDENGLTVLVYPFRDALEPPK